MKKIILLFSLVIIATACSTSEDSASNEPFFNLSNDNLWVYKRYNSTDNLNFTFINRIDSVRVIGDTLITGINFKKLQHKIYISGVFNQEIIETLRVDSAGHLVDQNNLVFHAGIDFEYQNVRDVGFISSVDGNYNSVGAITSQVQSPYNTSVEGVDYFVYPYYGNFVSTDLATPNNYIYFQYQQGIGLVCQHCAAVSGSSFYEDRLVYYDLN